MSDQFKVGSKVRITNAYPPGHIRTPFFLRGKEGLIIRHFGKYPNPERLAYGLSGLPKLNLYQVLFDMGTTWRGDGSFAARDTLTADIYETWLELL